MNKTERTTAVTQSQVFSGIIVSQYVVIKPKIERLGIFKQLKVEKRYRQCKKSAEIQRDILND